MMNAKMIDTALGMLARFIPPEEYAKAVKAINELVAVGVSIDTRMQHVEALVELVKAQQEQLAMLETIVRNNVPGAGTDFANRELYMVPGTIEAVLAPAVAKEAGNG